MMFKLVGFDPKNKNIFKKTDLIVNDVQKDRFTVLSKQHYKLGRISPSQTLELTSIIHCQAKQKKQAV